MDHNNILSEIICTILKLDEHATRVRFEITSIISNQIAPHEVQLTLYHSHFEIAEFSRYQHLFDRVASLLKSGNKKAFSSHFVPETEMMQYRATMVQFKTEMMCFKT